MMPCEDVRNLIEEHLAGTLDEEREQAVLRHLSGCPDCRRAVEEAGLAGRVLREASHLPPPPGLADNIKAAARARLYYPPRSLHERALGSPAFMATCASLLCGAIICLAAIIRVGSVPSDPTPVGITSAPAVEVHSLVRVERPQVLPLGETVRVAARPAQVRVAMQPQASALRPLRNTASRTARRGVPHEARGDHPVTARAALQAVAEAGPRSSLVPARQRTSLPEPVTQSSSFTSAPVAGGPTVDDLPAADARFTTVDLVGVTGHTAPASPAAP